MMQPTMPTTEAMPILDEHLDSKASEIVERYVAWSAAAGVIPVPLLDMLAVGGLQLHMLRRIAEIYEPVNNVHFSAERGKAIIASLVGTGTATMTGVGVSSLLKTFPGVGTILASLSMPALSAASTYAIGHVFIKHFASGGTLLNFKPEDYREFIKAQADKARARSIPTPTTPIEHPPSSKSAAGTL
jgi:uncharacterized protein (DUF697 family)